MAIVKIKKKFPTSTLILAIVVIVLAIVVLSVVFPGIGAFLMSAVFTLGAMAVNFAVWLGTSFQFWIGIGLVAAIAFIYIYRKNYAAKKVLVTGAAQQPLQSNLNPTVFDDNTQVEQA